MQNNFPLKLSVHRPFNKEVVKPHRCHYETRVPLRPFSASESLDCSRERRRIFCRSAGEWEECERQIRLRWQQNHLFCITTHTHRRGCSAGGGAANPHRVSRGEQRSQRIILRLHFRLLMPHFFLTVKSLAGLDAVFMMTSVGMATVMADSIVLRSVPALRRPNTRVGFICCDHPGHAGDDSPLVTV